MERPKGTLSQIRFLQHFDVLPEVTVDGLNIGVPVITPRGRDGRFGQIPHPRLAPVEVQNREVRVEQYRAVAQTEAVMVASDPLVHFPVIDRPHVRGNQEVISGREGFGDDRRIGVERNLALTQAREAACAEGVADRQRHAVLLPSERDDFVLAVRVQEQPSPPDLPFEEEPVERLELLAAVPKPRRGLVHAPRESAHVEIRHQLARHRGHHLRPIPGPLAPRRIEPAWRRPSKAVRVEGDQHPWRLDSRTARRAIRSRSRRSFGGRGPSLSPQYKR